ncbi:MAG: GAF domain-containing protein, partial [Chitinophagaceae bacterium]|nr:GAF domain-containing protein [Rubrivivax sp.]
RQQAERARAERAEAEVEALRAREGLLHAVTDVARSLLATLDFDAGVNAAMAMMGQVLQVDRVGLVRDNTPPGDVGLGSWQLTHEWASPGLPRQMDSPAATGTHPSEDWLRRSRAGEAVMLQVGDNEPSFDEAMRAVEVATSLSVPVFVRGTWWGIFAFDAARARTWLPHEVAVLQTATACIGAALERQLADAERQRADRDRAEDAEADARALRAREGLLQTVTRAARQLLAGPDFDASVNETLALLGATFQTVRAALVKDLGSSAAAVPSRWRITNEWHAPGTPAHKGSAAETGAYPSEDWALMRSRVREPMVLRVGECLEDFNAAQRVVSTQTILSVPVYVNDRWWGEVNLDDARRDRHWASHEMAVLQVAASCLGAALERQQAEAQRLAVAQAHTAHAEALAVLTQGVVRATRVLLDEPDFNAAMQAWLAHLGQAAMADAVVLNCVSSEVLPRGGTVARVASCWRRDGQPFEDMPVPSTTDFDAWLARLQGQESVWASIDELVDPRSVQYWRETDCASNLLMPVALDGAVCYVLCFDWRERRAYSAADEAVLRTAAESFAAVVARQRAADGMLAERDRRIEAEQARAAESARMVEKVDRHAQLLAAVAASAEDLLAAPEPKDCFDAILARLSVKSHAQRATLMRFEWTPDDAELLGWQEVVHEWVASGEQRQMDTAVRRFPMRRDEPVHARFEEEFRKTGRIIVNVAQLEERFRTEQESLGVAWSLGVPFIVDGEIWGLLGFDYATPFDRHDEAELSALQTVASSIADALIRQRLEARALAAERARADENARLASLLSQVVASSRVLIDAGPSGFEAALRAWLGALGGESQAIRATLYDRIHHIEAGHDTMRMLCEWVRDGIAGSVPCSFAQPFVIDPRGAEDLIGELTSGRLATLHAEQAQGAMRAFLEGRGNALVVAVPVLVAGRSWGAVSFDYAARREICSADAAILQTAADTLSAVLRRNEAAAALLAEREGRLLAEQRRSTELARSNAALRQSLDALA